MTATHPVPSVPADFRFRKPIPEKPSVSHLHLNNLELNEILFYARNEYITEAVGLAWQPLWDTGRNLVMRRLAIDFEREATSADEVECVMRARFRSRRTLVFEEAVFTGAGAAVCRAESVHLAVRFDTPGALDLPDDIVARFEAYEGKVIPARA